MKTNNIWKKYVLSGDESKYRHTMKIVDVIYTLFETKRQQTATKTIYGIKTCMTMALINSSSPNWHLINGIPYLTVVPTEFSRVSMKIELLSVNINAKIIWLCINHKEWCPFVWRKKWMLIWSFKTFFDRWT